MIRVLLSVLMLVGSVSTVTYRERFSDYARLAHLSRFIEVQPAGQIAFGPGRDGAGLQVGDTLRSDEDGFGEVRYFEGSISRLDASTTMLVQELAEARRRVRVHLDVGRTWHRVKRTTGPEERFEVSTPVAVATVRGTTFAVSCTPDPACTFVVFEGQVQIDSIAGDSVTLEAGQFVVVGPDGRIGPVTEAPDLSDNDWVQANQRLDRGDDPDEVLAVASPGNLAGTWDVEFRVTESINVFDQEVGDTIRQRWVVTQGCDDGACAFDATVTQLEPPPDADEAGPDTRTYTWEHGQYVRESFSFGECVHPETGETRLEEAYDNARAAVLRPSEDAAAGGLRLEGREIITSFPTPAGNREGCDPARQGATVMATRSGT